MTRKDYVKIAEVLRSANETHGKHGHWHVVHEIEQKLANVLAEDNPRFDRERFYKACEPQEQR